MANVTELFPLARLRRAVVVALIFALALGELPVRGAVEAQDGAQAAPPVDTSPAGLDHLLAPIALYPDALLMQVLAASVDSQEVLDAGNWLLENKSLQGTQIDAAAKKLGFGAATIALLHFPDVVDMMCTQLDWTQQLGAAFSADQAGVLDAVQRLRAQAVQYGNLQTTPQQQVVTQSDNGKQVIVIQPANPQVVYVPQYDPESVYAAGPSTGGAVAASVLSFGVGMAIGSLFSNNNYYYPRWGYGGVYYGGRPWYPSRYVYRPIYGPRWRRASGYRPPANYPYHRPNYNSGYYNSYRGRRNAVTTQNRTQYNGNRPGKGNNVSARPGGGNGYNGNRPTTLPANGNNRPNNGGSGGGYNKPGNNVGTTRPSPGNTRPVNGGYNRPGARPGNGGGSGAGNGNRPQNDPNKTPRPAPDRGYARPVATPQPSRPGGAQPRPGTRPNTGSNAPSGRPAPAQRPQATGRPAPGFSAGGGGKSVNAASQRGAASNAGRQRK